MRCFGSVTPNPIGLGADDGLGGCYSFGEVGACPVGCCYDEVEAPFGVGSEYVVRLGSESSLDSGDVTGSSSRRGSYGSINNSDAVNNIIHVAGAGCNISTVALRSACAGAGVAFVGVDVVAVGCGAGDSDVVGFAVSLPVEGDEVAWLYVPLADEDSALSSFGFTSGDVGAEPVDA